MDRRSFLSLTAAAVAAGSSKLNAASLRHVRRIATEEAFATPALVKAWLEIARSGASKSLDIPTGISFIFDNPPPGSNRERFKRQLLDIGPERLSIMDAAGVDMHLLSVTVPGVQMFPVDQADALATATNDELSAAIARHPTRFAGLAVVAPHSPRGGPREMERAITKLGLNGFIINSHTNNLYLDDPSFTPILEAAEALGRPIYLHPRAPPDGMAAPFRDHSLGGSIWGFGMEAGTHAVRLILSGTFDRYPKLRVVLGHMGEALPFWMWRVDHMYLRRIKDGRLKPNALKPSEYFRRNFAVTTSGFEAEDILALVVRHASADKVLWAIDYPYENSRDCVAFLDRAPLSPVVRAKILHRNAERLFRIAAT